MLSVNTNKIQVKSLFVFLLSSEFRFSTFFPSAVACACVSIATQKLKLKDEAVAPDTIMKFLANLLSIDLVREMFDLYFTYNTFFDLLACTRDHLNRNPNQTALEMAQINP